jgi:nucleoside-diphosphate-sugar epimerase
VARALLVGCGCRGRELGRLLRAGGWEVRGTSRDRERAAEIERSGVEGVVADPGRVGTVLEHVADVAVVAWLLGSAAGQEDAVAAIHGPRLERLLEELVDTPVRGFVYEAAGSVRPEHLERGAAAVRAASDRWRIPVEVIAPDPSDWRGWSAAAASAITRLTRS